MQHEMDAYGVVSLPARGVWIEMPAPQVHWTTTPSSLPARGVWIEIKHKETEHEPASHSPQGECGLKYVHACQRHTIPVTPRKGSVD